MSTNDTPTISRRSATALAAVLLATLVTALAAIGGFARWGAAASPAAAAAPAAQVVQQAPAQHWDEVDD
jgi:hypothetical protein